MRDLEDYQRAEDRRSFLEGLRTMRWWWWVMWAAVAVWLTMMIIGGMIYYEPPPPLTAEESREAAQERRMAECYSARSELEDLEYEHRHGRLKPSDYYRRAADARERMSIWCRR